MNTTPPHNQKFIPYLWFEDQAEAAAEYYVSAFRSSGESVAPSRVTSRSHYGEAGSEVSGKSPGSVMTVEFELAGYRFVGLNGGPDFRFNPAISFFVRCESEAEITSLWDRLSADGEVLMPLDTYPFSEKFGWVSDRFGISWQLSLGPAEQKITPYLMFVGSQPRAEAAVRLYTSLFPNSDIQHLQLNESGESLMHGRFTLDGEAFIAMDGGPQHNFTFNESISILVNCENQEEVDRYWTGLTDGGEEGPCGWLKDPFGVSWQIVPSALTALLSDPDSVRAERAMSAMLKMKKIDIAALERAAGQG